MRAIERWKSSNPALALLRDSEPEVQLSFVRQSLEWFRARRMELAGLFICQTLTDGILFVLDRTPKLIENETSLHVLTEFRKCTDLGRTYFPIFHFLRVLTREQITDEMRAELRKLHVQFAPSPNGKIDQRSLEIRRRIAELMWTEHDQQLDPGRGPWSQIVFEELEERDAITRAGWIGLLEHFQSLQQTVPGAKWKKRTRELMSALGEDEVSASITRWLGLGPTPGEPLEARSPIEDSDFQKGTVWCLALGARQNSAVAIGDFGLACLRKIPMVGAVSQKVGFACIQALGEMDCEAAVSQLTRLRAKVRYSVAHRLIEKSLFAAAERRGLTIDEVEAMSVEQYGLDADGSTCIRVGEIVARIFLDRQGNVNLIWESPGGKALKSPPGNVSKTFASEIRLVKTRAKEIGEAYGIQKSRLESSLIYPRNMSIAYWKQFFIEHPLLESLGRRLIWLFSLRHGNEVSGIFCDAEVRDPLGNVIEMAETEKVRLWHPISSSEAEIRSWREFLFSHNTRQPFRQAFRERYSVSDAERETKMYSNRFAGRVLRQHQFASLCRERGWAYRLMGANFDGFDVPTKELAAWKMHAQFHVDLLPDRNAELKDSALAEQSALGINVFLGSDQVIFYREQIQIPLEEVPLLAFSEIMRDVDLFTSVCDVGRDESWTDQGERGLGNLRGEFDPVQLSAIVTLRREIIARVLPLLAIAPQCQVRENCLEVRGQLGTYRIHFWWGGALRVSEPQSPWLNIPQAELKTAKIDFDTIPMELDHFTELILKKAWVLANDWKITSPELIRQLMPQ
ncbi:MAG: DUF4132 domain-containing protein [Candidatus Acidiferrum sp.]